MFDENWNKQHDLRVTKASYSMPSGFSPISIRSPSQAKPWLEVQFMTQGEPMKVPPR